MTTLIVNKATAKDINLLIDIAKKIGIEIKQAKPVVKQLSLREKRYLNNLKKVAKDIRENKSRKDYKTWEEFANEV